MPFVIDNIEADQIGVDIAQPTELLEIESSAATTAIIINNIS